MRPQMLSFLLVAVTIGAWLRTREDGRLRWWLVPMTWVWAMSHGMWPIGIVIGVVAVVGLALDRAYRPARSGRGPHSCRCCRPWPRRSPRSARRCTARSSRVGDRAEYFSEWNPPDYTSGRLRRSSPSCLAIAVVL